MPRVPSGAPWTGARNQGSDAGTDLRCMVLWTFDGEATADLGGMKVALLLAKKVENFDYDKFFRSYAYIWLTTPIYSYQVAERAQDTHPFNYLRTNVVLSQFDEFVETYDIKPGDGMYIPEEQRIKVW